jgi:adenylate cyclase
MADDTPSTRCALISHPVRMHTGDLNPAKRCFVLSLSALLALLVTLLMVDCGSESYLAKGLRYSELGKDADARIQFRKAIQKDPRLGKAYYYLGLLDFKERNVVAALADFEQAVELMPGDLEAEARLADLRLGAYLADPKRSKILYERIDRAARDLLNKDADSYAGLRLEGYLAMADGKPERAVEYFQHALRRKPDELDLSTALVQNLLLANRTEEAERVAVAFIQAHKSYGPMYDILYNHYIASHRPADAEQLLKTKMPPAGQFRRDFGYKWDC